MNKNHDPRTGRFTSARGGGRRKMSYTPTTSKDVRSKVRRTSEVLRTATSRTESAASSARLGLLANQARRTGAYTGETASKLSWWKSGRATMGRPKLRGLRQVKRMDPRTAIKSIKDVKPSTRGRRSPRYGRRVW